MADFSALKTAIQANIRTNGNEEINGAILQDILLSMVTTMGDGAINSLAEALAAEVTARQNAVGGEATTRAEADSQLSGRIHSEAQTRGEADTQLSNSITAITTRLNEGYVYAGIATPSTNPGTPEGKVFYIALQAGTYTNFSSLSVTQGITILKYNGTAWSQEQLVAIDDVPTAGSDNLVKSGGVFANIGAFDLSEYHKSGSTLATYADLTAALAALPSSYQKGGMSIKFVQSSDNKYYQYRLINQNWSTNISDWQKVGDELVDPRLDITSVEIAEVDSWLVGEYDGNGNVIQHGGRHAEVNWDASRPEMAVMMNWSLQGSVRHILAKDTNNNITSIFAPVGNNWYYPVIVKVPSNTVQLLVSQYSYHNNFPLGNKIYQIKEASNGNIGLIDKSVEEIIDEAKIEILGTHDRDITNFPNTGLRLNADGEAVEHVYCKLTDFIPIQDILIKQVTSCFEAGYLSIAFYEDANESTFISGINDIKGSTIIIGSWVLQTYYNISIPTNAKYMRVTTNTTLSSAQKIIIQEINTIPESIYHDAVGEDEYFTYSVDCGVDDIEDALKSTNIQGQTVLGTDNGYIRFSSKYSKDGQPTPLVILNHGAGGSVTNSSTENGSSTFAMLLAKKGYNVLCINGVPTTFRNTKYLNGAQNGAAAHMGGWVYQRSAICAYKYVTQKYNISKNGCAVIGRSMGGVTSLNLAFLGSIPVKVVALDAPVIDSYKDAYFSGDWSGGALGGGTAAIFAWIFQWDYCDFTNDTYTIPVGTYTIHGNTYNVASAETKSLASLKNNTTDMIIMWYLNRNKMAGYNAYKTANFLIHNLDNNYIDNQTTDNDDNYFGKKLPCPCKIWFGSGDTVNQQIIAQRFIQIVRNGGSIAILRTAPTNVHCVWGVTKALDGTTDISVVEDGVTCSPYGVELAEWLLRYLPV